MAYAISDWRTFRNIRNKTGVQARCVNGQLIEASGVGDVGFLIMYYWSRNSRKTSFLMGNSPYLDKHFDI